VLGCLLWAICSDGRCLCSSPLFSALTVRHRTRKALRGSGHVRVAPARRAALPAELHIQSASFVSEFKQYTEALVLRGASAAAANRAAGPKEWGQADPVTG